MSKTLFWYIFWNLFRVFFFTTGSLAGIMSFAGILRPLTENGLDFGQVNRLLLFMTPAMCTYSLPVAALFATTMVYGRFSADNELTAMRAGGIGYISARRFSIALPALVLGLLVAVISLLMLSFVVPTYSRKVQEVIYSNIARVIANKIERTHSLDIPNLESGVTYTIYADEAHLAPPDPNNPKRQQVQLVGLSMVNFTTLPGPKLLKVPREIMMAKSAWVTIDRESPEKPAMLSVQFDNGIRFPRVFSGNVQVGVASSGAGPFSFSTTIENVKFLNIGQLTEEAQHPDRSEKVQTVMRRLAKREQQMTFLAIVARAMRPHNAEGTSSYTFPNDSADTDTFEIGAQDAVIQLNGPELIITAPPDRKDREMWLRETHGSQETLFAKARQINVRAAPDLENTRMNVGIDLLNVELKTSEGPSLRGSFSRSLSVPMPRQIIAVADKSLGDFMKDPVQGNNSPPDENYSWKLTPVEEFDLRHEQMVANNAARSELHGRASFALSCLSLVMVGCALGVMFRSGNFLNAFAASFIPALLCITLIICGQQAATHVPFPKDLGVIHDPLTMALWFIWIGNAAVLSGAIYLTARLQKR